MEKKLSFLPFDKQSPLPRQKTTRLKGVIRASLCRRRSEPNEQDQEEDIGNALHALHLMNMGLPTLDDSMNCQIKIDSSEQSFRRKQQVTLSHHSQTQHTVHDIVAYSMRGEGTLSKDGPEDLTQTRDEFAEDELLLACLSTHSKLYVFSIMQLFQIECHDNEKANAESHKNILQTHVPDDSMSNSFESLILGSHVFSQLHSTVLPLTKPMATVFLSPSWRDRGSSRDPGDHNATTTYESTEEQGPKSSHLNNEPVTITEHFLDHMDPSFVQYRPFNNQATLFGAAFDYIVIGGKGSRSLPQTVQPSSRRIIEKDKEYPKPCGLSESILENDQESSSMDTLSSDTLTPLDLHHIESGDVPKVLMSKVAVESNAYLKKLSLVGGFLSIISLNYLFEIKQFNLPFIPRFIHPMTLQSTRFILLVGNNPLECVALQVDALDRYKRIQCEKSTLSDSITVQRILTE